MPIRVASPALRLSWPTEISDRPIENTRTKAHVNSFSGFKIGEKSVRVVRQELAFAETGVIVSPTDNDGGRVNQSLLERLIGVWGINVAGAMFCSKNLEKQDHVLIPGYGTEAEMILHIKNNYPYLPGQVHPWDSLMMRHYLASSIERAMTIANGQVVSGQLKKPTIAFVLYGDDHLLSLEDIARTMVNVIFDQISRTGINDAQICVPEEKPFYTFHDVLVEKADKLRNEGAAVAYEVFFANLSSKYLYGYQGV
ncbi:MAG: hypothetical protein WC405_18925 [Syntrophales bacterium]